MTTRAHPKLAAYAALIAAGLVGALLLERVALVALVAPLAVWVALGLALARPPRYQVRLELEHSRLSEGETVDLVAHVLATDRVSLLELALPLPPGLLCDPPSAAVRLALGRGEEREVRWTLTPESWGSYRLQGVRLSASDPLSLFAFEQELPDRFALRVYPSSHKLAGLFPPKRTQLTIGNRLSRQRGDGIEFADIRPFVPGDMARRVNWRVTARTGVPQVNQFQVERNSDLIIFLDSFTDLGTKRDSVLRMAVRAGAALAEGYLSERDRVGVIGFGGLLRWTVPGTGPSQLHRIIESMLDTEQVTSFAWKAVDVIPPRVLPAAATVVALSPLLDPRAVGALADLNRRGFDLLVVEIDPEPFLSRGAAAAGRDALSLWRLLRTARARRLAAEGVTVVQWRAGSEFQEVVAQAREVRRFTRKLAG